MRFHYNATANIKRLGEYTDGQSEFVEVAGDVRGFFIPLDDTQKATVLGIIGQGYTFTTDGVKDVRPNDIFTIEEVDYGVVGVARYRLASQDFSKVSLQLIKNG